MRQLIIVTFLVLTCSAFGYGQKQTYFATGEQCVEALRNGTANFYQPKAFNLKKAINPATEVLTRLEENECVEMIVDRSRNMSDYIIVAQPAGTEVVKQKDGLAMIRRFDCGNPIRNRWHIPIPQPIATPNPTPSPTPAATPAPEPKCPNKNLTIAQAREAGMIITDEGLCVMPKPEKQPEKECPECPDDVDASVEASTKTRFLGGLKSTAVSAGIACTVSGVLNKNWEDCLRDAAISAGANRAVQFVNPSPDTVKFTANGDTKKFRKGNPGEVGDCEVTWKGSTAILTCGDQECMRVPLPKNFNTTVFAMKRGQKTPIKTQLPSQIPDRGGVAGNNGGQIPGGGVPVIPGNGIPTRPRRPFAEESNSGSGSTQANVSRTNGNTTCNGTLRTIRGVQRCIQ